MLGKKFSYEYLEGLSPEVKSILAEKYKVQELDIEDVFTDTQLSKLEQRPNYLFVVLQFPEYEKKLQQFLDKEVHCFLSPDFFLVINKDGHKHTHQFQNLKDSLFQETDSSFTLFYEMVDFFITKDFKALSRFKLEINQVEKDIFNFETKVDLIKDILKLKRNLVTFEAVIIPLQTVIGDLQLRTTKFITPDGQEKLDDSLDKIKKMLSTLANFNQQMGLLAETNEALIARSTNETIKVLTAANIIAIVPTIIASFFGMNVNFGWVESDPFPLAGILIFTILLTSITFWYFKRRGWI